MNVNSDSFSSSQVLSKLWLAESLEKIVDEKDIQDPLRILILGGWYGTLHFIFRVRKKLKIENTLSIDIDADANSIAEKINSTWIWQNKKFYTDCVNANEFSYGDHDINIVINTSVEHFDSNSWFDNIPDGMLVVLQSNDMEHEQHCNNHNSLEHFKQSYPLTESYYSGVKLFQFSKMSFKRFMLIGKK
jgi:hypothetical protein